MTTRPQAEDLTLPEPARTLLSRTRGILDTYVTPRTPDRSGWITVPAEDGRSTRLTSRRDGPVGTGPVSRAGAPAAMIGPSCHVCACTRSRGRFD